MPRGSDGIDIFDSENIERIFTFNRINQKFAITPAKLYEELKEIQKKSENYVTDFTSYKKCLKAYYDLHGKDTEWLVKLFVERYDLNRFRISVEDVLEDVHSLMGTGAELPSFKK